MARVVISDEELEKLVEENLSEMEGYLDVPYEIDVTLGSSSMTIGDLLGLKPGDIIRLNRPSAGYVEVAVGGRRVGEAEVLVRNKGTAARLVRIGA